MIDKSDGKKERQKELKIIYKKKPKNKGKKNTTDVVRNNNTSFVSENNFGY